MYVSLCTSRIGMSSDGSKSFEVKKTLLDLCSLLRCGSGQPGLWGLPAERLRPAIAACAASVASQCGRGWSVTQWMHCCHDVPSVWRWPRVYLKGPPLLITEAYSLLRLVLGCMGKFGIHQWLLGRSKSKCILPEMLLATHSPSQSLWWSRPAPGFFGLPHFRWPWFCFTKPCTLPINLIPQQGSFYMRGRICTPWVQVNIRFKSTEAAAWPWKIGDWRCPTYHSSQGLTNELHHHQIMFHVSPHGVLEVWAMRNKQEKTRCPCASDSSMHLFSSTFHRMYNSIPCHVLEVSLKFCPTTSRKPNQSGKLQQIRLVQASGISSSLLGIGTPLATCRLVKVLLHSKMASLRVGTGNIRLGKLWRW